MEKETYQITNENGVLNIVCPVHEIVPLRKALAEILIEEIIKEFKANVKDGWKFGLGKQLGNAFHCTSNNINSILNKRGIKVERNITFEQ